MDMLFGFHGRKAHQSKVAQEVQALFFKREQSQQGLVKSYYDHVATQHFNQEVGSNVKDQVQAFVGDLLDYLSEGQFSTYPKLETLGGGKESIKPATLAAFRRITDHLLDFYDHFESQDFAKQLAALAKDELSSAEKIEFFEKLHRDLSKLGEGMDDCFEVEKKMFFDVLLHLGQIAFFKPDQASRPADETLSQPQEKGPQDSNRTRPRF